MLQPPGPTSITSRAVDQHRSCGTLSDGYAQRHITAAKNNGKKGGQALVATVLSMAAGRAMGIWGSAASTSSGHAASVEPTLETLVPEQPLTICSLCMAQKSDFSIYVTRGSGACPT